jgi:thioesterase domain-containing protein
MYKPTVNPESLIIFRSMTRRALEGNDELFGWEGLAAAGIEVQDIPGRHRDKLCKDEVKKVI